jgi:hypothetical protein
MRSTISVGSIQSGNAYGHSPQESNCVFSDSVCRPALWGPDGEKGERPGGALGDTAGPTLALLRGRLPVELHLKGEQIVKITESKTARRTRKLCVKGRFGYDFIYSEDR